MILSNLWDNPGTPRDKQRFTWRDMVGQPISKLDDDAFYTRPHEAGLMLQAHTTLRWVQDDQLAGQLHHGWQGIHHWSKDAAPWPLRLQERGGHPSPPP